MRDFIIRTAVILIIVFQLLFHDFYSEINIPLFTAIISLILLLYLKNNKFYLPVKFFMIFLIYIVFITISNLYTGFGFISLIELVKTTGLLFFVLLCLNLFKNDKAFVSTASSWILLLTVFLSLAGIVEFTGRSLSQKFLPLFEPFHYPSITASFFFLTLPFALTCFLSNSKSHLHKILSFISLALNIIVITLTNQYLFLLIISLSMGLTVYFRRKTKTGHPTLYKQNVINLLLLSTLLIFLLPNVYYSFGPSKVPKGILLKQDQYYFFDYRDNLSFAVKIFQKHPIFGIGTGNWGKIYRLNLQTPWVWSDYANNEIIQSLVENGIVGAAGFLVLFLYIFFLSFKILIQTWRKQEFFSFQISLALASFLILILFNPSFRIFPVLLVFYFLVCLIIKDRGFHIIRGRIVYIPVSIMLFFSLVILMDNIFLQWGKKYVSANQYGKAGQILTYLTHRPDFFVNPLVYQWRAALNLAQAKPHEAIGNLRKAFLLERYNQEAEYQLALIYFLAGNKTETKQILEKLADNLQFLPPKYYHILAKIALEENDQSRAIYWYKKAILFYPVSAVSKPNTYTLALLGSIDYLDYLQSSYLGLYEFTHDDFYYHRLTLLL